MPRQRVEGFQMTESFQPISPPITESDREKSGGENNQTNEQHNLESCVRGSATDGTGSLKGNSAAKNGARAEMGGEKLYKVKRAHKTARFIAKMKALRADPNNCKCCGKPRDCKHRQCLRCIEKAAKRRLLITYKTLTANPDILTDLVRRIESLEMRLAQTELWRRHNSTKLEYIKRREASLKARKSNAAYCLAVYPTITTQELATMNHAYDKR